jgi:hypothetical protein
LLQAIGLGGIGSGILGASVGNDGVVSFSQVNRSWYPIGACAPRNKQNKEQGTRANTRNKQGIVSFSKRVTKGPVSPDLRPSVFFINQALACESGP